MKRFIIAALIAFAFLSCQDNLLNEAIVNSPNIDIQVKFQIKSFHIKNYLNP